MVKEKKERRKRKPKARIDRDQVKIAKFLIIMSEFKDTDGTKRKRVEQDDAWNANNDHPMEFGDDPTGMNDNSCKKMKFGGAKSNFGKDPPEFVDGRMMDNWNIDGGIPLGPNEIQEKLLKTAELEQSRPFTIDHSSVIIKHDEVLINEIYS